MLCILQNKNKGCREGIKKKGDMILMALHIWNCSIIHTIPVNDVIPILPPAATLVVMFPKDTWIDVCELCLMLGGPQMWLTS